MLIAVIILAIVEGLTEFIPVSSTGHLVVVASLLRFDPEWREPFLVVIQLGAIAAVVVDRFAEMVAMLRSRVLLRFAGLLFVAFVPAAVLGLAVHDVISALLRRPMYVSLAWMTGGLLILLVDRERPGANAASVARLEDVSPRHALVIGLTQCLSLWPGMSRSGSTIIGGLVAGLDRTTATVFSFYLAMPTMVAASGYELFKFRHHLQGASGWFALGIALSFVVAWAGVRWLLTFVRSHSFRGFAIYRLVCGALLLATPASWWA